MKLLSACWLAMLVALLGTHASAATPNIKHVFVIVLENQSFSVTFGKDTPAPYLGRTLPSQGALLTQYYGIGHFSLDNYIAMVSGQPPNEDTQRDCYDYNEFVLRSPGLDSKGRALGHGCIYPAFVKTLPDQLESKGNTWRGYMEDMGNISSREPVTCGHAPIGTKEALERAVAGDQYAVKHNPFMYFHTIIDDQARCDSHVVGLDRLANDLADIPTTRNYTYIVPNLCNDGHDHPCIDGSPGGLTAANAWLEKWVPVITNSPAFEKDGLLIITFDEADSANPEEDSQACCGEESMPGAPFPAGSNGPGGGRIGTVLLSPFIKPGLISDRPYNHYSMLRSVEDLFGLPHLAGAAASDVHSFGSNVFDQ
ncbi:MAG TPA: alkaline phosphatase family protein [Rhizomicrobium sp.]|jgi:phospholipase C